MVREKKEDPEGSRTSRQQAAPACKNLPMVGQDGDRPSCKKETKKERNILKDLEQAGSKLRRLVKKEETSHATHNEQDPPQ